LLIQHTAIPGATVHQHVDGKHVSYKLRGRLATFTLRPVLHKPETFKVQITAKDLPDSPLPGIFKNSGNSSFAWFLVTRSHGRNAVTRPRDFKPVAGNAVLMWKNISVEEKSRFIEYLEKLCRIEIPRMELTVQTKQAA
jgi:hypothetical protein